MKFHVTRTSSWLQEQAPCPGATLEDFLRVDERTFKSAQEHDARFFSDLWLSRGMNHRETEDGIARDFPDRGWVIELEDLDALVAFLREQGECVLSASTWRGAKDTPHLEIYDDYRE